LLLIITFEYPTPLKKKTNGNGTLYACSNHPTPVRPEFGGIKGVPLASGVYVPAVLANVYEFTFAKTDRLMHIKTTKRQIFFIDKC